MNSWSGWVSAASVLDVLYRPLADVLIGAIPPGDGRRILDVGCGTGATTVAAARRGRCVGVDISEPMLAAARERAGSGASFVLADAQRHEFQDGEFDTVISRFGVMFFDDPRAAFANLRRACTDDAALRFVVWRSAEENPFMRAAVPAARAVLPDLEERPTTGPGPYGLADPAYTRDVLRSAGWAGADIRPLDVECTMPEADLDVYLTRIGSLAPALVDADADTHARVLDVVRPVFDQWVHGDEVRLPAACWLIEA
ncbi:class I SAM-dependent methyltransferase [Cryptosporangium sp. NPDC048952]|uniref:class I SAM-dependent methyltransferase n=1 Tax=Cryptosporangium sp. NPDC048952 TaxID=3363961 RepID=UPI00371A7115